MKVAEKFKTQYALVKDPVAVETLGNLHVLEHKDAMRDDRSPKQYPIVVGKDISVSDTLAIFNRGYSHFLNENRDNVLSDVLTATKMLKEPHGIIADPMRFFLKSFRPNNPKTPHLNLEFRSSSDKPEMLSKLSNFVGADTQLTRLSARIYTIADEMILNAIFNAPVDESFNSPYRHLSRSVDVNYAAGVSSAKFFVGHDKKTLVIGCLDPYGSVDRKALIKRLVEVYKGSKSVPLFNAGGAGLGCKMIIDNAVGFHVIVSKGEASLFCAMIPLNLGNRQLDKIPKNFSFQFLNYD